MASAEDNSALTINSFAPTQASNGPVARQKMTTPRMRRRRAALIMVDAPTALLVDRWMAPVSNGSFSRPHANALAFLLQGRDDVITLPIFQ